MATSPVLSQIPEQWAEPLTASWQAQRSHARELLATQQAWLEQAEALIEQQLQRIEGELAGRCDELERVRGERDDLAARLALMEACPAGSESQPAAAGGESNEDDRRRYELAQESIRELNARNAELLQQLDEARAAASSPAAPNRNSHGPLDWEAEKRRILAALESDFDQHDAQQFGERLKIEDVVHTTEQVVAEKDRQIRELKQRVEELRGKIAAGATPAAAGSQAIQGDAALREEQERLKRLQEELQEKCRKAEVEISLERAKLARQRAELEEQVHAAASAAPNPSPTANAADEAERPTRGRWLAKLGLTEADRDRKKR